MKKLSHFALIFFVTLLMSCSKDKNGPVTHDDDGGPIPGYGSMTAKIDGSPFSALWSYGEIDEELEELSINGIASYSDEVSQHIGLTISNFRGPGSYPMTSNEENEGILLDNSHPYLSIPGSGEIKITQYNGREAKGTFHFRAKSLHNDSVKEITNGAFSVDVSKYGDDD